jgi:hypothetical protein
VEDVARTSLRRCPGVFVVLDTAAGLPEMSELTAGGSSKFKEVMLRSHATTEIVK